MIFVTVNHLFLMTFVKFQMSFKFKLAFIELLHMNYMLQQPNKRFVKVLPVKMSGW